MDLIQHVQIIFERLNYTSTEVISYERTILKKLNTIHLSVEDLDVMNFLKKHELSSYKYRKKCLYSSSDMRSLKPLLEVNNFILAVQEGIILIKKKIDYKFICRLHSLVVKNARGSQYGPSNLRLTNNLIANKSGEIVYTPPCHTEVSLYVDSFLEYMLAPGGNLARVAVLYFYMLSIHPFVDGNGRVSNLLVNILCVYYKVFRYPIFSINHYIKKHSLEFESCISELRKTPDGINSWLAFFYSSIENAVENFLDYNNEKLCT